MSQWKDDPRSYALELVDEGMVSAETMMQSLLGYLSHDEVRDALDANELGPRFDEDDDE